MPLRGNIWKYFVYQFSQRRNFLPILSIFFLTLPNTTAKQIGLWTGIGFLLSMFFEVPSSYFADRIGHRETLILSKILMVISSLLFAFAQGFWYFAFGSAFMSMALAFSGGVGSAFMYDTMRCLKREAEYTKVMSRITAYISLISIVTIVALPFLTTVSMRLPFQIWLVVDIIGLLVVFMLVAPPQERDTAPQTLKGMLRTIRRATKPGFYPFAIFVGAISGFLIADGAYRYVYLQSLGYPVIFIGFVMGLSRFVWFLIGMNVHHLERISIRTLLLLDLFLFPVSYALIAAFSNPYVVGLFFSLVIGYLWGRNQIYSTYTLTHYTENTKYRATILSVTNQITDIFQMAVAFGIAFVMAISYKLGFLVLGIALFIVLASTYMFMEERHTTARTG